MAFLNSKYIVLFICSLALILRFWGVTDVNSHVGDEWMFVPASENYFNSGHSAPDSWLHPPFHYYLLRANILLFGDNALGWRSGNVLFGALSVLLLILVGRELFDDKRIAYIAGALLAVEPFHIVLSRSSFREVPSVFLFLVAVYGIVRYLKGRSGSLLQAGVFLGLAIALKWYYIPALAVLLLFTLIYKYKEVGLKLIDLGHVTVVMTIIPLAIYLITFYPWFQRGYTLPEFIDMQLDVYYENQNLVIESFSDYFLKSTLSSPSEWFLKPLISAALFAQDGMMGKFFVFMSNPPFWLLTFPAFGYLLYRTQREKDKFLLLVLVLFIAIYLQFVIVKRPIFLYSALVVLPFAYLAVSFLLVSLLSRLNKAHFYYTTLLTFIFLWGLYLYPFVTSRFVPIFLYSPLVRISTGS